eukprot:gene12371-13524_t
MIAKLPCLLLSQHVYPYLIEKEKKSFVQTSKIWMELRSFYLNRGSSMQFYQNERFRDYILQKIENPLMSLSLNLSFVSFPIEYHDFFDRLYALNLLRCNNIQSFDKFSDCFITKLIISRCNFITDLPQFPHVKYLTATGCLQLRTIAHDMSHLMAINLFGCVSLTDVSALKGIPDIDLTGCVGIREVNCLREAKRLILSDCTEVTDVSELGQVKVLHLEGCCNLRDISCLRENEDLNLSRCPSITDVSSLAKVKKVNLSVSGSIIIPSHLKETRQLDLSHRSELLNEHLQGFECVVDLSSPSLPRLLSNYNMKKIILNYNEKITTVHNLAAVEDISIAGCRQIKQLPTIHHWRYVNISYCNQIDDLTMLTNLYELHCVRCDQINDSILPLFQKISILNLSECQNIEDVSCLSQVKTLNLSRCSNVSNVSSLGHVKELNLSECLKIKEVHQLQWNEKLNLSYCQGINCDDIPYLKDIKELNLAYCTQVMDVSCLVGVKVLYLHGNPQIKDLSKLSHVQIFK